MNYAYLFVDNLNGHPYENGLNELKASILSLKKIQNYDSIQVFNNETHGKNIEYFEKENIIFNHINLSRNYGKSDNINPINILVEKIICLMNFDEDKDITLIDIDTEFQRLIPDIFWNQNQVVFDNVEYPIMDWRNLDKILPNIPWKNFDINFDSSFLMYNTGVVYLPKKSRKELCEKALKIVDYLNYNFSPEERCGNNLDEQIALSIVCHDAYGRFGNIKYSKDYIHHHWESKHTGNKWWEKYDFLFEESKYGEFMSMHSQSCLDLALSYSDHLNNKVIIDVGSNIGLFTKAIAENISYEHIHLFEPSIEYLNKSKTILKNFKNITYNNVALGNCKEEKTLYKSKDSNIGWNTLYQKDPNQDEYFFERMNTETVLAVVLDDYYKDIEKLDFIKIDVEGYERNVLEGSWNLIKKFKPYILIEVAWGVNHPDWDMNKKTYEKLFSLGYERFDLNSLQNTRDILFKPKNNVTLVTGLWDAGRGNLGGIWNRPFSFYLERFLEVLKTDNNLIVFGDEELKRIVFEYRTEKNTQFIFKDLQSFRDNDYYPLIQKIRNDPTWINQNDWLKDSPIGGMEMAIPLYLSKMILLNEAVEQSKFDSEYFYHIDGGTRMHKDNFSKDMAEEISKYTDFFFISFPYIGKEIHGFDYEKIKELTSDSPDMVSRATFFGGHKNNIKIITPLYYQLMMDTLNEGFMGIDESLFTVLTYNYPNLIDYYRLDDSDNGDPEIFFTKFIRSEDRKKLFKKIKRNKLTIKSHTLPLSLGILSWNSEETIKNTLETYKSNGLFDVVNDVTLFFQECSDEDVRIANEYKIPFIAFEENIGIGKAFIKLCQIARTDNILLLENDWELIENKNISFDRLKSGIDMLDSGYDCIRYRHRENPGYPLYSKEPYCGNELNHYDDVTDSVSPHLIECCHWIDDMDLRFPDKIQKVNDHYVTSSRWSCFTNNPCMYKKEFYLNQVKQFESKSKLLENDISYWWIRQDFKIAWGEGLFRHNDIEKYGNII